MKSLVLSFGVAVGLVACGGAAAAQAPAKFTPKPGHKPHHGHHGHHGHGHGHGHHGHHHHGHGHHGHHGHGHRPYYPPVYPLPKPYPVWSYKPAHPVYSPG